MSSVTVVCRAVHSASLTQDAQKVRPLRDPSTHQNPALRPVKLTGSGAAVPPGVISNDDLSKFMETNDEWIASRTGIRRRHVLGDGESLVSFASDAAQNVMSMAEVDALDIDMVLLCTSTPEDLFGSACELQALIGAKNAIAFDLTAACSGFVVGLITASQFIQTGAANKILLIGADALSRYVDWTDRRTSILFGDGAGAVVMEAGKSNEEQSLLGFSMRSNGDGRKHLLTDAIPTLQPVSSDLDLALGNCHFGPVAMNGGEVFKFAVRAVPQVIEDAMEKAVLTSDQIDWLVLHQANQRIMDAAADRLGIAKDKVISNISEYGNTSAASIPIALDEAVRDGRIKKGQTLATAGFGAGLTWAAAIFRWGL